MIESQPVHDLDPLEQDMLYSFLLSQSIAVRFLITFYLETGIRCSEGLELTMKDARTAMKLKTPTFYVKTLKKRGKATFRAVPIRTKVVHPNHDFSLYSLMKEWLELRKKDPNNFRLLCKPNTGVIGVRSPKPIHRTTALRCAWSALRAIGLHDRCLHDLRHTFACNFLRRGGSLPVLAKLLGHSSLDATSIYIQPRRQKIEEEMNL